jgi:short-subunit dehydrogenase
VARNRETALITGASGGIGLELALIFAANGFDLVIVARREKELGSLADRCRRECGVEVQVMPMDLLAPGAAAKLVQQLDDEAIEIDVLVNNAGLMDMGRFAEIDVDRHERLIHLNVIVLTSLTRHLVPKMIARGRGRILNVGSISAFQPVPALALYAATKAFVLSLSESLSEELRGTGVTVTALCPGITKTDMYERAQDEHESARSVPDIFLSDVKAVAKEGFDGCLAGRVVIVPGRSNQLMTSAVGFYPRWVVRGIGGLIGRRSTRSE